MKSWIADYTDHPMVRRLLRAASGTMSLQVVAVALAFATTLVLARLLGPAGYGVFAFASAAVNLLTVLVMFGMDNLVMREVAVGNAEQSARRLRGILRFGVVLTLLIAVLSAGLVHFGLTAAPDLLAPEMIAALLVAVYALPFIALMRVVRAALRGIQRPVIATAPFLVGQPLIFFLAVLGAWLAVPELLTAQAAVTLQVGCYVLVAALSIGLWLALKPEFLSEGGSLIETGAWLRSALPLLLAAGASELARHTDRVMLGFLADAEAVGLYNVASRTAILVTFFLTALNVGLTPYVADRFAKKSLPEVQQGVTRLTRIAFAGSLALGLFLVIFADFVLALFGPEFVAGRRVLEILVASNLAAVFLGSVTAFLTMTHHERWAALGIGAGALLNIVLNLVLIPRYGMEGAAIATLLSGLTWKLLLLYCVIRFLGLDVSALGWLHGKTQT